MQATLQALQNILNPEKCIVVENSTLSVIETGKEASLKSIHIVSVGQNALALKFDQCGFPGQKVFIAQHEMHRACDAVTFCLVGGEPFILCIELKSSEPSRSDISSQFRSAHCFLDFLNSLLGTYDGLSIADWPRRYFLFHDQGKSPLAKAPLFEEVDNDTPEKALFLPVKNGESMYLRKLLRKPL